MKTPNTIRIAEPDDQRETRVVPAAQSNVLSAELVLPDPFDERRIQVDLWRSRAGGPVSQLFQHRRTIIARRRETEILKECTTFYKQATELARAKEQFESAAIACLSVGADLPVRQKERELQLAQLEQSIAKTRLHTRKLYEKPLQPYGQAQNYQKQLEVILARMDAEIDELKLRSARAQYEAEHVEEILKPPPAPVEEKKRKPTIAEVRQAKVRRQQVAMDDQLALKFDRLKVRDKIREKLSKLNLSEDESETLEQDLIDELESGEDTHAKTL